MRVRLPLGAAGALGALCALALLFNSEVLVARRHAHAPPGGGANAPRATWQELAAAQPFVYEYHAGTVPFPMLGLAARAQPNCPGGPDAPPYVTVASGGRLGNLIMEYAAAWALARAYDLPAYVPDRLLKRLKSVFAGLSLRGARAVVGGDAACRELLDAVAGAGSAVAAAGAGAGSAAAAEGAGGGGGGVGDAWEEQQEEEEREWRPWAALSPVDLRQVPLAEVVRTARQQRALIVLDICSLLPEAVVPLADELRKELVFQPLLRKSAQAELRRLRKQHFPHFDGEVVYGAVHARRTDYHAQLQLLYNVTRPAGVPFFISAAAWLQRGLQPHQRLLLVVSSDDAPWAQEELVPALRAAGESERVGGGWAAAWAGSGDPLRPDRDLALLSACNHTLFAYGTFGLAAALAAGGRAAVYQLAHHPLHRTLLTPAEQFARHMPGWVALR